MNMLIVEDNEHKRKKITDFILSINSAIIISEAYSYTGGLNKCLNNTYDLLILDMTMPNFDKTSSESGGRFRTYGGKDIIRQLERKNKQLPFLVVSQYPKFNENSQTLSLQDLGKILKETSPEFYVDTIFYDTSSSSWKKELQNVIMKLL